jgi:hypothetical protein
MNHRLRSKILLFLYLCGALLPARAVEEAWKLPEVWRHYAEHCASEPQLSLLQFLQQHYGRDYAEHRTQHDHTQLPGKGDHHGHNCVLHVQTAFVLPVLVFLEPSPTVGPLSAHAVFSYHFTFLKAVDFGIWQPPKTAIGSFS